MTGPWQPFNVFPLPIRSIKYSAVVFLLMIVMLVHASSSAEASNTGIVLPDGSVYHGKLKNGLLDGTGRLRWPDGDHYEGEFVAGRIHGHGIFTYSTGEYYEGNFSAGARHGRGRLVTAED